jgi:hypothetical protein
VAEKLTILLLKITTFVFLAPISKINTGSLQKLSGEEVLPGFELDLSEMRAK